VKTLAFPDNVAVSPGESGNVSVAVTNSSSVIDAYRVQVYGLDPSWVRVSPERLSLFPGETANVSIDLDLPADYPASHRMLTVNVVSDDDPGNFALSQVELVVTPLTKTSLQLDPVMVTAGKRATFGMVVNNVGNAAVVASAYAVDPEDLAEFTFEPAEVVVAPGREQVIQVTAEGGRAWFGQPRPRTFTFGVHAETPVESLGTWIQRPRVGRWMLTLLGLLTAAALFAAVLGRSFDRVVEEARISTAVLDAALNAGGAGGVNVPTNPATITGSLVSRTTGEGFAGATAELFLQDNTEVPIATGATDAAGAFSFGNLGTGPVPYLLRLSGSGVNEIWYADARTAADATPITVTLDQTTQLDPIEIGGIPVPVEGTVDIEDPSGVTVTLFATGLADSNVPAEIASVPLNPDGTFTLPAVPSPGTFELVVSKPGFASETQRIVLQPGQPLSGVDIRLRPGNGVITGRVTGPTGPLGGATIVATDGTNRIETVSLTNGDVGTFALRDLAVPGQYSITVTRPDFATEARTVNLDPLNPQPPAVDVRLLPATGSVQGRALLDGAPGRGLTVNISGGDVNRTTAVISQGPLAGTYSFFDLPAPRTYTLTFAGADTAPQVRVVDLDPLSNTQDQTGIDASLSSQRRPVFGVVRDIDGSLLPGASVVLTDGADDLRMFTSHEPSPGRFEFSDIAPGAYTLTASRLGAVDVVVLVNVSATAPTPEINVRLGRQAGLSGRVVATDVSVRAYTVRLYTPELFPFSHFQETTTDANGNYRFNELAAPEDFVIGVLTSSGGSSSVLDSLVVRTQPGTDLPVPDIVLQTP
jgi:hypothetical protein